jgi:hypothetical protein
MRKAIFGGLVLACALTATIALAQKKQPPPYTPPPPPPPASTAPQFVQPGAGGLPGFVAPVNPEAVQLQTRLLTVVVTAGSFRSRRSFYNSGFGEHELAGDVVLDPNLRGVAPMTKRGYSFSFRFAGDSEAARTMRDCASMASAVSLAAPGRRLRIDILAKNDGPFFIKPNVPGIVAHSDWVQQISCTIE